MRRALEMVEVAALTPEERAKYDGFQDWLCRETRRANAERRAERLPQVEAERDAARAERDAAVEKLRETARKMKGKGFAAADIAGLTGLSTDEIAAL